MDPISIRCAIVNFALRPWARTILRNEVPASVQSKQEIYVRMYVRTQLYVHEYVNVRTTATANSRNMLRRTIVRIQKRNAITKHINNVRI